MTSYDIKNLPGLLPLEIKNKVLGYSVKRLTADGEHYGSLMLRVDINVKGKENDEVLHLVAKCVPKNKAIRDIFNTKVTFKNEIAWYKVIIPLFKDFQKENGLVNLLDRFPKYFGSRLSLTKSDVVDCDGVILLENLAEKGYKTKSRFEGFNLEISILIVKHLAAFHATGLALKTQKPNEFQQKILPYLKHDKEDPTDFYSKILEFLENETPQFHSELERIKKAVKYNFKGDPYSDDIWKTSIHNDFWVNNILVREKGGNSRIEIAILDFQIAAYGSIALDLILFLIISVNGFIAKQYMDSFMECYYKELIWYLKRYGMETSLFSYKGFLEDIKKQGTSIFARAMFTLLIVLGEEGTKIDSTREDFDPDELLEKLKRNMTYKQKDKCCFIVEEFVRRNWI